MFAPTVSQGKDVYFWKTMPRSRPGPSTGFPFTIIWPLSGRSRPAIILKRVDFPHPEGPSKTRNSPMSLPSGEKASHFEAHVMYGFDSLATRAGKGAVNVLK